MISLPPVVSGCSSNNDCPDYTACEARKCINPCAKPNACAPNANCRVTRHRAICTCPDGYVGSPEVSCSLRKIFNSLYIRTIQYQIRDSGTIIGYIMSFYKKNAEKKHVLIRTIIAIVRIH